MEHEKNTRSKPEGVSSREKEGKRENQRINRYRKIATSQTMTRYAACMLHKTIPCFITVDCGIVLAFEQIAFFFHIVFELRIS